MFTSLISFETKAIARLWLSILATTVAVSWSTKTFSQPISSERVVIVAKSSNQELADLVQQVHQGVNQYRGSLNLAPLSLDEQISREAEMHSQSMAQGQVEFSHQGFDQRAKFLSNKILYRRLAENVAYNQGYQDPAQIAVAGWIESEGHRQNMIGNYNLTGIGVAKNQQGEYYFTQIFIGEK
jgi:uncharacterized protein YkwD